MKPIKVKVHDFVDGETVEAVWVDCDDGAAVVIHNAAAFRVALGSLEVLKDVTCESGNASAGSGRKSRSKPPVVVGSATRAEEPNERKVGPVRKRRRKRASSPRGPRSNQWQPEKSE